jgi:hypothetical protein
VPSLKNTREGQVPMLSDIPSNICLVGLDFRITSFVELDAKFRLDRQAYLFSAVPCTKVRYC